VSVSRKAVKETVGYYFNGVAERDIDCMRRAFHPDCKMMYVQNGVLAQVAQEEWYERIRNNPPAQAVLYRKIISVDITGNAASVKAETDFTTFKFIDYLSLLKIEGRWKIVNKLFYRMEK
jgi:sulfur transfer complex TusBCD TusB component (DsrH family)